MYGEFRFSIIGFGSVGSVNLTEILVSVISVFTRFGRTLVGEASKQARVMMEKGLENVTKSQIQMKKKKCWYLHTTLGPDRLCLL